MKNKFQPLELFYARFVFITSYNSEGSVEDNLKLFHKHPQSACILDSSTFVLGSQVKKIGVNALTQLRCVSEHKAYFNQYGVYRSILENQTVTCCMGKG
jgi:hypothetical protein